QEMFEKPKKKLHIRFAVRTPPINCKPVTKVLPCTTSVGSNDPDVILLDADEHDEERILLQKALTRMILHMAKKPIIPQLSAIEEDKILAALELMLCAMDQSLYLDYNGYINS
ncbi:hypothetical protein Tco_0043277, partial [Tanacetum coccineum]